MTIDGWEIYGVNFGKVYSRDGGLKGSGLDIIVRNRRHGLLPDYLSKKCFDNIATLKGGVKKAGNMKDNGLKWGLYSPLPEKYRQRWGLA